MITQELVGFIKQQLQEGKSKEQIANILTPHGWELADINAVFAQLLPTAAPVVAPQVIPPVQPVMQSMMQSTMQPTMQSSQQNSVNQQNQVFMSGEQRTVQQSMQQPMRAPGFMNLIKNPSALVAGVALVLSSIATTLIMYYMSMSNAATAAFPQSQFPTTIDQNSMIAGILASTLFALIVSGLITKLVTKILSIAPRTFAQAFTFSSIVLVVSILFSATTLVGVPVAVPAVAGIILWVVLFWYYYGTGIGKAIGAFFLNLLVGMIIAGAIIAGAFALGVGMIATLIGGFSGAVNFADVQMTDQQMMLTNESVSGGVPYLPLEIDQSNTMDFGSASGTILTPEEALSMMSAAAIAGTGLASDETVVAMDTAALAKTNPDYTHVKDALPVGFLLPKEEERIITAAVLSANTYEGVRYILEYTSTNSLAYLRNNIKTALEKAGYTYSINEKDLNHRVITATQVLRGNVRSFRIELMQVGTTDATVKVVFNQ